MSARSLIERITAPVEVTAKTLVTESSLSRIWQALGDASTFAVISAFKSDQSPEENEARQQELKNDVRGKYGFIQFDSGYTYAAGQKETIVREKSVLVRRIALEDALALARKYEQEAILWKDENGFRLVFSDGSEGQRFRTSGKSITFDADALKVGFSALRRANREHQRAFSFVAESNFSLRYLPELSGFSRLMLHALAPGERASY